MCGISGIVYSDRSRPVEETLLRRMATVIAHRGPDAEGFHLEPGVGLASRRLRIIDVVGGDQPIYSEDRKCVVILNGEVYNFQELRVELETRGHRFLTRSDTEAIVHAYEEFGEGCVAKFRGMFAFALWDATARRLLLARDRVGKKPLYYLHDGERLSFASELKALLEDPSVRRAVDLEALDDFLTFGAVPAPKTIYHGIHQLPPAHFLLWDRGQIRIQEYWDVPFQETDRKSEGEYLEEFGAIFDEAVRIRMISEVPLGAFLSGGVDSTTVVASMASQSNRPVVTISVGFNERAYSELGYARAVAQTFKTDHHEVVVAAKAVEILPKLVWHLDEPLADSSAIPTYYVAKAAREHVTVALSGDGGDEIFAGYQRRYGLNRWETRIRRWAPRWLLQGIVGPIGRRYPKLDWLPRPLRLGWFMSNLGVSFEEAYFDDVSLFRRKEKSFLLTPEFRWEVRHHDNFELFRAWFRRVERLDELTRVLYLDFKTSLVNDILVKVDRMSMATSLEVRSPLLDHKVIEFAARLPANLKFCGRTSKYFLKRHLEGRLPKAVIHRPKMGFSIPLAEWLRGELRPMGEELLFSPHAISRGYFVPNRVRSMWQAHQRRVRDHSSHLWGLMVLELWHRSFVDRIPCGPST